MLSLSTAHAEVALCLWRILMVGWCGNGGPGHVPPESQLSRTSGARKRIRNPTAPACAALSFTSPNLFKFGLNKSKDNPAVSFPFFQLSASEMSLNLATLPRQTVPGWWPGLVKKSCTRLPKSPCIWCLLQTAQTTKVEGQRFPSWSKTKIPKGFTHHSSMYKHAWDIPQNKAWA